MTGARANILAALRASSADRDDGRAREAVAERLAAHARNVVPARAQVDTESQVRLFVDQIAATHATVETVSGLEAVPDAVFLFQLTYNPFSLGYDTRITFEADSNRVLDELIQLVAETFFEDGVEGCSGQSDVDHVEASTSIVEDAV